MAAVVIQWSEGSDAISLALMIISSVFLHKSAEILCFSFLKVFVVH